MVLSKAECDALNGVIEAYRLLDGPNPASAEFYTPKMIGPKVGPDLGKLGAIDLSKFDPRMVYRTRVHTSDSRAIFQRGCNISPFKKRQNSRMRWEMPIAVVLEREISYTVLTPLSIIYGGLHLLAWTYHFPSEVESIMWLSSCMLAIAYIPKIMGFVVLTARISANMPKTKRAKPLRWLLSFLGMLFTIIYFASRIFIVAESFISLRSVPIGAYLMPRWLNMIPHL